MSTFEHESLPALSAPDAEALDALVEASLEPARVPRQHRERAGRIARLLGLLRVPGSVAPGALTDVTYARVLREAQRSPAWARLSSEDAEALDAWVDAGYSAARVPSALRARAQRLEALAGLVTAGAAPADGLVERTLELAERAHRPISIESERARRFPGVRLADLVSVAAVLLIAGSIMWPVLAHMRAQSQQYQCAANLGRTASALSTYAGDHGDVLPVVNASLDAGRWWDVGSPDRRSNSANLYELARVGYADLQQLACPGNPSARLIETDRDVGDWRSVEEISYSYQNMYGPRPVWRGRERVVILADRSPIVLRLVRGETVIDPLENSPNHDHRGQHVLFTDGSAEWVTRPELATPDGGGDLIWWPRYIERFIRSATGQPQRLNGTEVPAGVDDAFVGP